MENCSRCEALESIIESFLHATHNVVENWPTNRLAEAVNALQELAEEVQESLGWKDSKFLDAEELEEQDDATTS